MAGVAQDLISDLISKGVEKIASRKNLTSQDLTVLLLHEQSRSISGIEKGMQGIEIGIGGMQKGMEAIAERMEAITGELRELRREVVPLLNQARDIADIRAKLERIEAKVS